MSSKQKEASRRCDPRTHTVNGVSLYTLEECESWANAPSRSSHRATINDCTHAELKRLGYVGAREGGPTWELAFRHAITNLSCSGISLNEVRLSIAEARANKD